MGPYKSYHEKMKEMLDKLKAGKNTFYFWRIAKNLFNGEYFWKITKNLFNGEYFYHSILSLKRTSKKEKSETLFEKAIQFPDKEFVYTEGYFDEAITLPDGSHVYSHSWLKGQKHASVAIGGGGYKIDGKEYDPQALEYLRMLVELYRYNEVDIKFIMTPYHPNVFKKGKTKPVVHFSVVEQVVNDFSRENNIKSYGSFFPDKLGCLDSEFYDYMHPTNECLGRIDFSQ